MLTVPGVPLLFEVVTVDPFLHDVFTAVEGSITVNTSTFVVDQAGAILLFQPFACQLFKLL